MNRALLFQERERVGEAFARQQEVGSHVKLSLQHPVRAREIRLAVHAAKPAGEFADDGLELSTLLDRDVTLVRCDRISTDMLRGRH